MRHDQLPKWHVEHDKRYGSEIVRQEIPGYKSHDGVIILYGDLETVKIAGVSPDALRLLVNLVLSKTVNVVKLQREAREILARAGIDIWDF